MFYFTTHSTHFIYGYMALDIMVQDHSDSERGNPLSPHGQQGLFYMHHPTAHSRKKEGRKCFI